MSTKHTLAVVSVVNQEQGEHSMKSGGLGKDFPVPVLGEVGSCLEETEAEEATAFSLHVRLVHRSRKGCRDSGQRPGTE